MQFIKAALHVSLTTFSAGLLIGCSSAGITTPQPTTARLAIPRQALNRDGSEAAPPLLSPARFGALATSSSPTSSDPFLSTAKREAITDLNSTSAEIFNGSYALKQTITAGLTGPVRDWYDQNGNLYIANYNGPNVVEYAQGGTAPTFTYSAGLVDPVVVTTDELGNVYIGDLNNGAFGFVNEYAQGSNSVMHTCSPGGAVQGVAVGEGGQVFVAYDDQLGNGTIAKYRSGLAGCHETVLGFSFGVAGGIQQANNGDLVVCDQNGHVYIVPRPYNAVKTVFSGFTEPYHVALNKGNTLMFVVDIGTKTVDVLGYPGGGLITTLGSAQGLTRPFGVATFPYEH